MKTKRVSVTLDDERTWPGTSDRATFVSHVARYQFALQWVRPEFDVLETGCGTGYGTQMLGHRARSVLGVDYSDPALEYATQNCAAPNVRYARMDCQRMALPDESFDCIVSFEVFEHLPDQRAYLTDCRRLLRPGGLMILSTPNRTTTAIHMDSIGMKNDFHVGEVDLEELRALLGGSFGRVHMYGQRRRGNPLYTVLRSMDIWNLRLHLLKNNRRERMQNALGVAVGHSANVEDWVFTRSQLRQSNHLVAVCWKNGR